MNFTRIGADFQPEKSQAPDGGSEPALWRTRLAAWRHLPRVLRLVWKAAPHVVATAGFLRLTVALIPLGMLAISQRIIDLVVTANKNGAPPNSRIWYLLLLELALASAAACIGRLIDYCDIRLADEFTRDISLRVMDHASRLDLACFEDSTFYDKLERARVQATDRVAILTAVGSLFQRSIALISMLGGILAYSPWICLLLLVCVLPAFLGESHFAFRGYELAHRLTPIRRQLDYLRLLGSSRDSAKEVKMYGLAPHFHKRFDTLSGTVRQANMDLSRRRLLWGVLFAIFGACGYYGGYVYLVWLAVHGAITVGTLMFLAGAIAAANTELQTVFSVFSNISEQSLFLSDLITFLRQRPTIRSKPDALPVPNPIRKGIEFQDVCFSYPGADNLVLDHFNLFIEPGQRIALVGENGQGKTTLVKLLARLYEPTSGRILIDGVDIREYSVEDLRRDIGVIFQDFFKYDMAVRENIAAGSMDKLDDDSALWEAARRSGAGEIVADLPDQMEQMLGRRFESGMDLSGGQWQRIALARAYLRDAQVLILDEPTAALDAAAEAEVFQNFAELTLGKIALLISHRFSTVRIADRIVVLANGKITEEGTHDGLVASNGHYARLFNLQAANYR